MASSPSAGSLDTTSTSSTSAGSSTKSHPAPAPAAAASTLFSFPDNHNPFITSSFSTLLAEPTGGSGVPRFKSIPPPISPPSPSFSSYFSIPPGLSPAELLDSPVLLNSSSNPSPTTGTIPAQAFINWNWKASAAPPQSSSNPGAGAIIKEENNYNNSTSSHPAFPGFTFQSGPVIPGQQQGWNFPDSSGKKEDELVSSQAQCQKKGDGIQLVKHEFNSTESKNFSNPATAAALQPHGNMSSSNASANANASGNTDRTYLPTTNETGGNFGNSNSTYNQHQQPSNANKRSDDGYNWRKYGQKQVKASENPRSYYKCTFPNCPTKKKVEKSVGGQITEIVYKGSHNHPKPHSTRRSSNSSYSYSHSSLAAPLVPIHALQAATAAPSSSSSGHPHHPSLSETNLDRSFSTQMGSATPENSSISMGNEDLDQGSQKTKSEGGEDSEEDEPDAKRWKREGEVISEGISGAGSRTVREPRVVVQTTSDIDILDDGYRWRKYGQKVVKGNPNPRSYYKCTHPGCPVRKHVERASQDLRAVITTYEGKHNHDVPAARGSGLHSVNRRPLIESTGCNANGTSKNANNGALEMMQSAATFTGESPFTLEMMMMHHQEGPGGFGRSMGAFMNHHHHHHQQQQQQSMDNLFPSAKDEPRDDLFLDSLLC